jgi:hypothetical protein
VFVSSRFEELPDADKDAVVISICKLFLQAISKISLIKAKRAPGNQQGGESMPPMMPYDYMAGQMTPSPGY